MPQSGDHAEETGRPERRSAVIGRRGLLLGGICLAAAGAAGWAAWRRLPPQHGLPRLTAAEAFRMARAGEVILVDIRTPREWRATGLPGGGQPLDMRRPDFIAALAALAGGSRDAPVALICARGGRSARMALVLAEAGFTNVMDVPEGMLGSRAGPGWVAANLPVVRWDG